MLTVICPTLNEEAFIENILQFFIDAKPSEKELFIVDGNSTDKTREIVLSYASKYNSIHLVENKKRIVPFALNKAIKLSKGDPIIRLDAHTEYAPDYFEKILEAFDKSKADIVGGPMRAVGKTDFQKAVAYCTSTSFGVGDSSFHNENHEGFVDSVYLGAWRRDIFNDVGMFDTEMLRNQDDEFHYRAKSKGKTIYLSPEIRSWYYPRDNVKKLFIQYFQYGLFKPLVLKKVKSEIKLRHLIPALFVIYLMILPFGFMMFPKVSVAPLLIYFLINLIFVFKAGKEINKVNCILIYPVLHLAYGLGFLSGILNLRTWFMK